MNVQTLQIDRATAAQAFREYREAVRHGRTSTRDVWKKEDSALMRAYKHLAAGHRVLDLHVAMKSASVRRFDDCEILLPAIALAPSDAAKCHLDMKRDGSAVFSDDKWSRAVRRRVTVPAETFPRWDHKQPWAVNEHTTLVPIVPPLLRPKFDLANYWTLFEVTSWKPEPAVDPMLLKPLGGALYAVLATWELSAIERAVLRGRV